MHVYNTSIWVSLRGYDFVSQSSYILAFYVKFVCMEQSKSQENYNQSIIRAHSQVSVLGLTGRARGGLGQSLAGKILE